MDRIELAKRFYKQAQKMTIGMAMSVFAYGAIGFYLIGMGKAGPAVLNAGTYPLVKYGALVVAILGVFAMQWISARILRVAQAGGASPERHPQKFFVGTIVMSFGAELAVLLGLILVFLGRQPYDYIPFAVVSLTGFAFAFPQKKKWSEWLGIDL
jgi:hypothetical protein